MSELKGRAGIWSAAKKTAQAIVAALLAPALHLWPWLVADLAFFGYLLTSQGRAVTDDMAGADWVSRQALHTLTVSFVCTLAASLLTSLVVTSARDPVSFVPTTPGELPERRWAAKIHMWLDKVREVLTWSRMQGALHLLWGFGLATAAPAALLLRASPAACRRRYFGASAKARSSPRSDGAPGPPWSGGNSFSASFASGAPSFRAPG